MGPQPTHGHEPSTEAEHVLLDISFPADEKQITPAVELVAQVLQGLTDDSDKQADITLALTEGLANAVRHGSKSDSDKLVSCRVATDVRGAIVIVVRDCGAGFDPDAVPDPTQNLESDHGRGIYLIRQLMDEVTYSVGGTELRMKKSL